MDGSGYVPPLVENLGELDLLFSYSIFCAYANSQGPVSGGFKHFWYFCLLSFICILDIFVKTSLAFSKLQFAVILMLIVKP